jgi:AraC family transcriptional regulator
MTNKTWLKEDYIGRINKAIAFIEANLDKDLSLDNIAREGSYSPFHFHRIFAAITGETLNAFINRRRIERVASALMKDKRTPITELAAEYGFNSPPSFTRSFKKFYGISPSQFRENCPDNFSKICKAESKNGKAEVRFEKYICNIVNLKNWIKMNAKIEVKELDKMELAYVSHVGAFDQIGPAFEKLMSWAGPKGLMGSPNVRTVTMYHDDPKVTEIEKLRQSACITLEGPVQTEGEVGLRTIAAGKYVVGSFEIGFEDFEQAWHSVFVWLLENGLKTKDADCFDIHYNDFRQHPENKTIVDICVPVE